MFERPNIETRKNDEEEKLNEINKMIGELETMLQNDTNLDGSVIEKTLEMLRKEKTRLESKI